MSYRIKEVKYLDDCSVRRSGWSIYIDDIILKKEIEEIYQEIHTIGAIIPAKQFDEVEKRLEKIGNKITKCIPLMKKQILAGIKTEPEK